MEAIRAGGSFDGLLGSCISLPREPVVRWAATYEACCVLCRKWRAIWRPGRAASTDHWGMLSVLTLGSALKLNHRDFPVTGLKPAQLVLWDAYPPGSSEWS